MKKRSEPPQDWQSLREKVIGLGERSIRKSYYPELQQRLADLEAVRAELERANKELQSEIYERKQTESALRESETLYRMIFENSGTSLLFIEEEGMISLVNKEFEKLSGYSREEVEGKKSWTEFVKSPETLEKDFPPDEVRRSCESSFTDRFGQVKDILATSTTMPGTRRIMVAILEITELKRAEQAQKVLAAQLHQAQKLEAVGRLAGGVAHDFNNMLSIIIGYAEMALGSLSSESPLYHGISEIKNAADRSADLTRQLLAFARKQTISPKVLDLNDAAEKMLNMLRRLIGEDIELCWFPGVDLWPVSIDPCQADQILANLAVNARDAIDGIGRLSIETANVTLDTAYCLAHKGFMPGDYVLLAVSDTGAGMKKEIVERIFEPFFTTKELGKGAGLGLATIYGIVKQNNGFIYVYSEPGHGTSFKIYLPRVERIAAGIADTVSSKKDLHGSETILLVEDEEAILKLAKSILELHGYKVLAAKGPGEALKIAGDYRDPIHMLITDVVMPEMNGRVLREKLLALKHGLKCIYISGYTANVIAHHGVLDEGLDFLQKPFSVQGLVQKVRDVLLAR
ncbi:MAG: PAS domain S-box protein [Syntrophobacteraceae bacterium]